MAFKNWPKEIDGREVISTASFLKMLRITSKSFYSLMQREERKEVSCFPIRITLGHRQYLWFKDECERFAKQREKELRDLEKRRGLTLRIPDGYVGFRVACTILKISFPQMGFVIRTDENFPEPIRRNKSLYFKESELKDYYKLRKGIIYTAEMEIRHREELLERKNGGIRYPYKVIKSLKTLKGIHNAHKKPADKSLIVDLIERSSEELKRYYRRLKSLEVEE